MRLGLKPRRLSLHHIIDQFPSPQQHMKQLSLRGFTICPEHLPQLYILRYGAPNALPSEYRDSGVVSKEHVRSPFQIHHHEATNSFSHVLKIQACQPYPRCKTLLSLAVKTLAAMFVPFAQRTPRPATRN